MTRAALLDALMGQPVRFTANGIDVLLRPLRFRDRVELIAWHREHKDDPDVGLRLQQRYVSLALCDEAGTRLLTEQDVDLLGAVTVDAIADEVARRNGLAGGDDDPKAPTPGS